jgi:hypothetical protein
MQNKTKSGARTGLVPCSVGLPHRLFKSNGPISNHSLRREQYGKGMLVDTAQLLNSLTEVRIAEVGVLQVRAGEGRARQHRVREDTTSHVRSIKADSAK